MKKIFLFIIILSFALHAVGQVRTTKFSVYPDFKPAIIQLKDGRFIQQRLANIFLKNSSLLYMHGSQVMEANMDNIVSVKFDDRLYQKVDTLLAYVVDSVGNDVLYQATVIDLPAYTALLRNNQVITNLSLGDMISTTTMDISTSEDFKFPLIDLFYFRFKGKLVKAHERNLSMLLNKDQKRIMRTFVTMNDFSWTKADSLLKLLKSLQSSK
jgi:hypothetical protein